MKISRVTYHSQVTYQAPEPSTRPLQILKHLGDQRAPSLLGGGKASRRLEGFHCDRDMGQSPETLSPALQVK